MPSTDSITTDTSTLDQLIPGQKGTITRLHSGGLERRRMMDLGLIPGTVVYCEFNSPLDDPIAYKVRGTLIALRRVQAQLIDITYHTEDQP